MVGVAKTKAQACIEVHDPHGISKPLCTPLPVIRTGPRVRSEEVKHEVRRGENVAPDSEPCPR